MRRNTLYSAAVAADALPKRTILVQAVQQCSQSQQIRNPKGRATSRDDDERILGPSAGPRRCEGTHHPVRVDVIHPFYPPAHPALKQLELSSVQGMKRVRHPKGSTLMPWIECS